MEYPIHRLYLSGASFRGPITCAFFAGGWRDGCVHTCARIELVLRKCFQTYHRSVLFAYREENCVAKEQMCL